MAMLKRLASLLLGALLFSGALTVNAANEGTDPWRFNAALYLWLPSIGGGTATDSGVDAASGIYILQMRAGSFAATQKLTLLK